MATVKEVLISFSNQFPLGDSNNDDKSIILTENCSDIIANLGGIRNVIKHCLQDETYCQQHMSQKNINNLQQLFDFNKSSPPAMSSTYKSIPVEVDHITSQQETLATSTTTSIAISNRNEKGIPSPKSQSQSNTIATYNSNHNLRPISDSNTIANNIEIYPSIVPSIKEFKKTDIHFNVNAQNNFYFKLLPNDIACKIFYNILQNKYCVLIGLFLSGVCFLMSEIYRWTKPKFNSKGNESGINADEISNIFKIFAYIFGFIFCLLYFLSLNINIMKLIIKTFAFWFKVYNFFVVFVLFCIMFLFNNKYNAYHNNGINDNSNKSIQLLSNIIEIIAITQGFLITFFIEALFMPNLLKFGALISASIYTFYWAIVIYFTLDYSVMNYNPFSEYGIKQTNMNFKSLFISSMINIAIFQCAPAFKYSFKQSKSYVKKKRKSIRSKSISSSGNINSDSKSNLTQASFNSNSNSNANDNTNGHDDFTFQATLVHKRPYFEWTNVTYVSKSNSNNAKSDSRSTVVNVGNHSHTQIELQSSHASQDVNPND